MCPHATETVSPRQLLVACSYTMIQVWAVLVQSRTNHAPGASWVVLPAHAPLAPICVCRVRVCVWPNDV